MWVDCPSSGDLLHDAPFGQTVLEGPHKQTFFWSTQADADVVQGILADVSFYGVGGRREPAPSRGAIWLYRNQGHTGVRSIPEVEPGKEVDELVAQDHVAAVGRRRVRGPPVFFRAARGI